MRDKRVSRKKKARNRIEKQEVSFYKYGVPPEDLDPETTQMGGEVETKTPPDSDEDSDDES